jgi:hypothetical protein
MDFTDVPLERAIPAGVVAYLVGYFSAYLAVAPRADALLRGVTVDIGYGGGVEPLFELLEPAPETWKVVGWFFHAAQHSKLVNPQLQTGRAVKVDLVAASGGAYQALYLVAPVALFVAGYVVARTATTYGVRGEDYAGAAVALGYLPCAAAGGLLYTVGHPAVGPDLLSTVFLVGVAYPVAFGWLGGFVARMRTRSTRSPDPTPTGE